MKNCTKQMDFHKRISIALYSFVCASGKSIFKILLRFVFSASTF